jgi:hypothetical protein
MNKNLKAFYFTILFVFFNIFIFAEEKSYKYHYNKFDEKGSITKVFIS